MARAEVNAGICGFKTTVETKLDGDQCKIAIQSECPAIQRMASELTEVNPYKEISFRRGNMPHTLEMGHKFCTHAACPVPVGIIKAIEVESSLALPADVEIKITRD